MPTKAESLRDICYTRPHRGAGKAVACFIAAGTLSRFSRGITVTTMIWLLLESSSGGLLLGWNSAAMLVAFAVGSITAGHFVDHVGARCTTIYGAILGAGVIGFASWLMTSADPSLPLLMTCVSLGIVAFSASFTSYDAAMPILVARAQLPLRRINAADDLADGVASALAAPAAGLLISWIGSPQTLILAALMFAVAGVLSLFVLPGPVPRPSHTTREKAWRGLRAILSRPTLAKLVVALSVIVAVASAIENVLLPVLTRDHAEGPRFLGTVIGSIWFGAVCGSALMIALSGRYPEHPLYLVSVALMVIGAAGTALAPSDTLYLLTAYAAGAGSGILSPLIKTVFQESVRPDARGRALGAATAVVLCIAPGVVLLAGAGADKLGAKATLLIGAIPLLALLAVNPFRISKTGSSTRFEHHD